jgi:hypothetical protein
MIQSIQDVNHPLDQPLTLPSIRHFIAVDQVRAQRIRSAGVPEERITFILDEVGALRYGIAMLADDDLMVVLADRVPGTLRLVQELLGAPGT